MNIEQTDNFIASLGFEAYRVGGSVRDEIIGRAPKDADYMIRGVDLGDLFAALYDALPSGSQKISDLVLRDGQHVGYRVGRPYDIEIALPRREESTGPGHGDFKIVIDPDITLEEDAKRRDFTFNALYAPVPFQGLDTAVIDPTGRGLEDLHRRIINVTHVDSFRDDPLRILRALRFVARGYDLGPETHALMSLHSDAITGLTYKHEATSHVEKMDGGYTIKKRIPGDDRKEVIVMSGTVFKEMSNILMGPNAVQALRIARDTGVLGTLFPELAPMIGFDQDSRYHDLTTDEHTFHALETAVVGEASLRVRWALLFHDSGKPQTKWFDLKEHAHFYAPSEKTWTEIMDYIDKNYDGALVTDAMASGVRPEDHEVISARLWRSAAERMSGVEKEFARDVETLIRNHMVAFKSRGVGERTRRMRVKFGAGLTYDLLMHRACDLMGKGQGVNTKHVEQIKTMVRYWKDARAMEVPTSVRELEIDGNDVKALYVEDDMRPDQLGRRIGIVLRQVLDEVVVRGDEMALTREWQLARAQGLKWYG